MEDIYIKNGYKDRTTYLMFLSEKYGLDYKLVVAFSNLLGEAEDFGKLIENLEFTKSMGDEYGDYEFDDEDEDDYFDFELDDEDEDYEDEEDDWY